MVIPSSFQSYVKPALAELLGTFFLALTIGLTVLSIGSYTGYEVVYAPLAIGGVVGLMVYCLGPISGCHLNPAVSTALLAIRRISFTTFVTYVVSQLLGAFLGFMLVRYMMGTLPTAPDAMSTYAMVGEVIGAFILLFAITRVVLGKVPDAVSGIVIGGALTLAIGLSMFASGGVLNPAIAVVLGANSLLYYIAPLVGGVLGSVVALGLEPMVRD